jgi:two-component system, LytTR family, response regulator
MLQSVKYYPQPVMPVVKKEPLISLPLQKLRVDTVGQVYYFVLNDIVRIQSYSNYSKIIFKKDKPMLVAKVLRRFEEQLKQADFVRIHRSHLINRRYLQSYSPGTEAKIFLANGDEVPVAKRRKTMLRLK